ncbi:MAG: sugar-binding domain-containing protein [Verrucomicrobiota bacterium]
MKPILSTILPLIMAMLPCVSSAQEPMTLPLAGSWRFQLDANNTGVQEKWFANKLEDRVKLPGTTDENHKGILKDEKPTDRLARLWFWKGPAWYQRDVTIPASWADKRITLFFERTKNSRVWVDDTICGREDSLSAPHVFDLTKAMTPGKHTITVLIDNAKLPPVGPAHAVDERTQTNWNGIVGKMELRATDPVWIDDVQVFPDVTNKTARVQVVVGNITGKPAKGKLTVGSSSYNVAKSAVFQNQTVEINVPERENRIEFVYLPGGDVPLWDEFQRALMKLDVKLNASAGETSFKDQRTTRFGMRSFTRDGSQLLVNGKPVFLRGRLDCANYPLTGYPPMGLEDWRRIFKITNDWGINHYRFHSWCPPAAAFEAADELGVYLQVELPNKRSAFNAPDNKEAAIHNIDFLEVKDLDPDVSLYDYGKREGRLIFRHFGNSPSFVMFTLGNELGSNKGMSELVADFKKADPRHLYAQGSNNDHWKPNLAEGDDFWVTGKVEKDSKPLRGSFSLFDFPNAPIEGFPPSTMFDFRKSIEGVPVPLIGHETGQYQVYPDYRDIPKFTGVTRARNYEIFRERITKAGMLDQTPDFVRASGALAAICYREDIELALRTPGFGGFQLLDIQDFPGQGTALVGMLNDFMESKGVIEPATWRQFCSETVPLLRMEKYTWTADETFKGKVQVAHYGPADFPNASITATVTDDKGAKVASTVLPQTTLKRGGLVDVGEYSLPLNSADISPPQKLKVTLAIKGTRYRNSYPIWVYPPKVDTSMSKGVMIANSFMADATRQHLAAGGKVLLLPKLDKLPHSVPGGFQCEFWSPMFAEAAIKRGEKNLPPGTLGFLCDPKSPALAAFPTEFHSNWQWWQLVKNSRPIQFDDTPKDFRPIVQVIDNFVRNSKLGLIAETKVGKGSMLICAIDLPVIQDKPEGRQMLHSLLAYMNTSAFAPAMEIDAAILSKLLPDQ